MTFSRKITILLLFLNFYIFSCKKNGINKESQNQTNQKDSQNIRGENNQNSDRSKIDVTQFQLTSATTETDTICASDVYRIKVDSFDPNTQYFEYRFCNPKAPKDCLPNIGSFSNTNLTVPNFLSEQNISQPLIQIRSCVRAYDALDPSKNCQSKWSTIANVAEASTDAYVSSLLRESLNIEAKILEQCISLREGSQEYLKTSESDSEEDPLNKALQDYVSIGVDNCLSLVSSGSFEAIYRTLGNKLQENNQKDQDGGLNLSGTPGAPLGSPLGTPVGGGENIMGNPVFAATLGLLAFGAVLFVAEPFIEAYGSGVDKYRNLRTQVDMLGYILGDESLKDSFGEEDEELKEKIKEKKEEFSKKIIEGKYTTEYLQSRKLSPPLDRKTLEGLGYDWDDLRNAYPNAIDSKNKTKINLQIKDLQKIPPSRMNKYLINIDKPKFLDGHIKSLKKAHNLGDGDLKAGAKIKQKSYQGKMGKGIAGVLATGAAAGIITGLAVGGVMGLADTPKAQIQERLLNFHNQIFSLIDQKREIQAELALCEIPSEE